MFIYIYVCIYTHTYVFIYMCIYICIYIYEARISTKKSTTTQDRLLLCVRELQGTDTSCTPSPLIQLIPNLIRYKKGEPADAHEFLIALRWGWVFLERTRILSGIQFITYFIEIFVMETKRFVGNFVNVILTRQTCGQRWSRAAESKRRVIGNYFSEQICYMFLISKCRGDRDLGLCTTSVLGFGQPQCNGKIWEKNVF